MDRFIYYLKKICVIIWLLVLIFLACLILSVPIAGVFSYLTGGI